MPEPDTAPQLANRLSPAPRGSSTDPSDAANANKDQKYSEEESKNKVSDENKISADGIIVTEKTDNNLLEEMADTKMTDLSQTRQYNSFDSMGDEALLLSCGPVRVGNLQPTVVSGSDRSTTREDSTSRSVTPPQFVEPSPVRPRPNNASPSCSRRSLSMEVDDNSERNSQSEQQAEPMEVSETTFYYCPQPMEMFVKRSLVYTNFDFLKLIFHLQILNLLLETLKNVSSLNTDDSLSILTFFNRLRMIHHSHLHGKYTGQERQVVQSLQWNSLDKL